MIQEWRDGLATFQYGATEDSFMRTVIWLDVDLLQVKWGFGPSHQGCDPAKDILSADGPKDVIIEA